MIELTVLCEGPTESGFVSLLLKPHLSTRQVFCKPIPLNRVNFGVVPWDKLRHAIKGSIGNSKAHQYTTCMIDLYALPNYPGQHEPSSSPVEKVQNIEMALRGEIKNPRWLPYIQLHEFEALLYADLDALDNAAPNFDLSAAIGSLKAEVAGLQPEDIDEGRQTAPSKRILRRIPEYAKAQLGPAAAKGIGLQRLRDACPHFREWLERLEGLVPPRQAVR